MAEDIHQNTRKDPILIEKFADFLLENALETDVPADAVDKIQQFFDRNMPEEKLRLDISLYAFFYERSNGFEDTSLQRTLLKIWRILNKLTLWGLIGSMRVCYKLHLDGGGLQFSKLFTSFVKERFPGKIFYHVLDWCAGPGFIGFELLSQNLLQQLSLTDISSEAIDCALNTISVNNLQGMVKAYVGDNLEAVPKHQKFDLVVGNPPWALQVNNLLNPLISSDVEWTLHRNFYNSVKDYLIPGALICLTCYKPFETNPHANFKTNGPWDIRPEQPIVAFKKMIDEAGLVFKEIIYPFNLEIFMGEGIHLIVSQYNG
ncbi:MAG: methyltransferase [Williamsia sp.]|nr:methyltransferase [Williamsia sp.]